MQFADVKNDVANEEEGLKTAFIEADKYKWNKEELIAYDNVRIKEHDERGEKELVAKRAKEEGPRACIGFHDQARASKFYFRQGKICSRMRAIRRKF